MQTKHFKLIIQKTHAKNRISQSNLTTCDLATTGGIPKRLPSYFHGSDLAYMPYMKPTYKASYVV